MSESFNKIKELIARNATHERGFKIGDQTPEDHLKYAAGEMIELAASSSPLAGGPHCGEIFELADVMNCLDAYAIKRGWTEQQIDAAQCEKLNCRFKETDRNE